MPRLSHRHLPRTPCSTTVLTGWQRVVRLNQAPSGAHISRNLGFVIASKGQLRTIVPGAWAATTEASTLQQCGTCQLVKALWNRFQSAHARRDCSGAVLHSVEGRAIPMEVPLPAAACSRASQARICNLPQSKIRQNSTWRCACANPFTKKPPPRLGNNRGACTAADMIGTLLRCRQRWSCISCTCHCHLLKRWADAGEWPHALVRPCGHQWIEELYTGAPCRNAAYQARSGMCLKCVRGPCLEFGALRQVLGQRKAG